MGEIPKSKGPNSALYQRLNRTRNKHNEDHDTILTLADFAKNVLGVTVKVSNQTFTIGNFLIKPKNQKYTTMVKNSWETKCTIKAAQNGISIYIALNNINSI